MIVVITGGIIGILIWATLTIRKTIMDANERLIAAVHRNTTVTQGVVTMIADMAQRMRDSAGNKTATNALADELEGSSNALAAAMAANTVADGEAHPETGEPIGSDPVTSTDAGSAPTTNGTNVVPPPADEPLTPNADQD